MNTGLSVFAAITTIVNNMLGVGINLMPASFYCSGYLLGGFIIIIVALLTGLSIYSLFLVSKKFEDEEKLSYSWIGKRIHSSVKYFLDVSLFLKSFFISLGYQKYVAKLLNSLILIPSSWNFVNHIKNELFIVFLVIPFFLISMRKNLSSLRYASYLSVLIVFSLMITLVIYNFIFKEYIELVPKVQHQHDFDYSFSLSNFILGMCCQINVINVFRELKNKSLSSLRLISFISSFFGLIVYGIIGILGLRLLGSDIGKQDIMSIFANLNSRFMEYLFKNNKLCYYINIGFVIGSILVIFGCFALQISVALNIASSYKRINQVFSYKPKNVFKVTNLTREVILIILLTLMSAINMIKGLDLSMVFSITGVVFSNAFAYFVPFGYFSYIFWTKYKYASRISILLMILSISYSIYGLISIFSPNEISDTFEYKNITDNYNILNATKSL